ncbi:GNAT family N-acetyltransferase [Nostoc sp.]|uniref:GNAT family N-acetyltransferase n=1 Tax=Nostoc sp. TaxID=1180 RepID=UPI003FA5BED0
MLCTRLGGKLNCLLYFGDHPYGLIENVITYPDYRCQGVGRRLIHHTLQSHGVIIVTK